MSEIKKVLVTGGMGYIGSHTVISLVEKGYTPIIIDNLSNSSVKVLTRLEKITGSKIKFYQGDCTKENDIELPFSENKIDAVIHFAALKAVGESVQKPLEYYKNNLLSTLNVLSAMTKHHVKNFIFSSSATVYGVPKHVPLVETDPVGSATNPYGETKIMIERILHDYAHIHPEANIGILRYFNPIGAHKSGLIGESPNGVPNNLMPYLTQVAVGKLKKLKIYGNDYPTIDGTGVRDYVHVVDLAEGHVLTLKKLATDCGLVIYNLGTGKGTSVLELVAAYEKASNIKIPYEIVGRREGDVASNYASTEKAKKELGFQAKYTIEDACRDSNNWQQKNPNGYDD
ncbi:MAG: UDP-glucose 4-epimerase GalE [Bacilli bacterium]|nr:UDP-glucose 4-epimerase GalE [Bacilli bacterium]